MWNYEKVPFIGTSTKFWLKTELARQKKRNEEKKAYLDPIIFLADSLSYSSSLVPLSICIDESVAVLISSVAVDNTADHMISSTVTQIHIDLILVVRCFFV